jgi:hypothetical protein
MILYMSVVYFIRKHQWIKVVPEERNFTSRLPGGVSPFPLMSNGEKEQKHAYRGNIGCGGG